MTQIILAVVGFGIALAGGLSLNYMDTGHSLKTLPGFPGRFWGMFLGGGSVATALFVAVSLS